MEKIEHKIVSLRAVTVVMLFYIVGYCVKLTMTLQDIFIGVIPFVWLRFGSAFFISLGLATGLLLVSVHKHEHKWLPRFFAFMDVIRLMMIFSTGAKTEHFNLLGFGFNIYIPTFKKSFFSVLMALIGYELVAIFVKLMNEEKQGVKQFISELIQAKSELLAEISEIKQGKSEQERKLRGGLTNLNQTISEEEQIISERLEQKRRKLQDFEKRTCKCGAVFGSINGLNAHKWRCKDLKE